MVWQGFDDRKFPRVNAELKTEISLKNKKSNDPIKSSTINIGVGGLCIYSNKSLALYDEIELNFKLPKIFQKKNAISCTGRIVWVIKTSSDKTISYDLGVEFLDLKIQDKEKIENYINTLARI